MDVPRKFDTRVTAGFINGIVPRATHEEDVNKH